MNIFIFSSILILIIVHFAYVLSSLLKRYDIMDIVWGLGFAIIAISNLIKDGSFSFNKILLCLLIGLWALRLALHIYIKNKGKAEDFRYANWRKNWGQTAWWRSYFQIFLLQGFFMAIISLPIVVYLNTDSTLTAFDKSISMRLFFALPALFGLLIESLADYQKSRFKKSKPMGIMKTGLWKYSRHPNYFGEAVFWWGIAFYTFGEINPIFGLIAAICITLLLRFVSGVPMLEKAKEGNAEYMQYKKETPVFIPFLKP